MRILVTGSGGYLGRSMIPIIAREKQFQIAAITSNEEAAHKLRAREQQRLNTIVSKIEDIALEVIEQHDLILNFASAGVAHKDEDNIGIISENSEIAHKVSLIAKQSRRGILVHLGSDTEQINLSAHLNRSEEGSSVLISAYQQAPSIYSMSKIIQSSIIHRASSNLGILAHVVMTPNVFGGDDAPSSLRGSMKKAIQAQETFRIRNPHAKKRFAHFKSFTSYIMALLQDIEIRTRFARRSCSFEVSSMDFVPVTTVGEFAQEQWRQLGGDPSFLILG